MIAAILIAFTGLSGCITIEDDPYYDDIVGTWELTGVPYRDINQFEFYYNGTGRYNAFDPWGQWNSWDFRYYMRGSHLEIDLEDGQHWDYLWAIRGNNLILTDLQIPDNILFYRYVYR